MEIFSPSESLETKVFWGGLGFVNNTAENLAEKLFGTTVDELRGIDGNNEESAMTTTK